MDTCKRWRLQRLVLQAARGHCARRWSSSGKSCSSWRMPLRVHRKRPGALRPHWGARQRWRWAELQRGVELQLLGAEPSPDWLRGDHQGALKGPLERPGQSQAELSAMLASGVEPEVLVSIKALCKAREEELQRPRPLRETQEEAQDWLEQAQAALGRHSPGAVLWALEALANHSTRALLASPAPSPQAPPTLRSHIQLRLQQHLRFLSAATRGRRAALRPLQEQVVGVARAGLGSAPPQLEGEGRHRRGLVLGALGEPLPNPGALPPLWETGRGLGGPQGALLSRAAILKQQLRQGALSVHRRRGLRGLGVGPGPEVPPLTPPPELTTQLRLVSTSCQERIRAWPRLLDLLDQWWTLPAQWTLATPRGHAPFSHWLQRWQSAALTLQATPTLEEGEGQGKKAPPPEGL
ncbi:uncharacterized protein LOC116999023 isoform X6 [Catharus ustulatus]|uniref:uncharacterized protein LOC116999023 isoform X6 n=1 Tax=Catharus ustulatus TaxID=91951 RepID=UPI001409CF1A|nr:uncharacterized protein LOC116999023 isoform X6 [Catharus ustulatus]